MVPRERFSMGFQYEISSETGRLFQKAAHIVHKAMQGATTATSLAIES